MKEGSRVVARQATKQFMKVGAKTLAKGAVNPVFIAADVGEFAIEKATGSKVAAKSVSAAAYLGGGFAVGGPAGALVGGAIWGVGQLVDLLWD